MAGFHYQLFLIVVSCIKTFEKPQHCHCERSEAPPWWGFVADASHNDEKSQFPEIAQIY